MRNGMKKWCGFVMAAVMVCAMGMTAFAANSPTASGVVNKVSSAVDKNGNAVEVEIQAMPEEYKEVAKEIKSIDKVKEVLGNQFVEGMEVVDVQDVVVVGDKSKVEFPLTLTFKVPGVLSTTKVAVLHYSDEKKAWEVVPSKAGNGTIEATFDSLSPVAFVVDKNTSASAAGSDSVTSPKTGEGMTASILGISAIVLFAGAVVCLRRREVR